uniref:Uncharacterized protein n=1 Tax=Xenopus tropicalis TaxID=8364 RepID=A0A1B8XY13_XENTR
MFWAHNKLYPHTVLSKGNTMASPTHMYKYKYTERECSGHTISCTFIMPISVSAPGGTLTPSSSGKGICAWSWTRSRMPAATGSPTHTVDQLGANSSFSFEEPALGVGLVTQLANLVGLRRYLYPSILLTASDSCWAGPPQKNTTKEPTWSELDMEKLRPREDSLTLFRLQMVTAGNLSLALEISMIFSWEGYV